MIKKIGMLFLTFVLAVFPVSNVGAYSGTGAGTAGNPYIITTCQQVFDINDDLDGYYVLGQDVFCSDVTWEHIGSLTGTGFSGTLDGQGYSINNLTVSDTAGVGLFTYINGGTITNLRLNNFDITGTGTVGTLAARADNATISLVRVTNSTVISEYATGGLVGILNTSDVSNSSATATFVFGRSGVSFANNIGGLVGESAGNTYHQSFSSGTVSGVYGSATTVMNTGGVVGYASNDVFYDSYSSSLVYGLVSVGGFAGSYASSAFYRSYASGSATGNTYVGGFGGSSALSGLVNSFATAPVVGTSNLGGLLGRVQAIGGDVTNSTWDVTRTGRSNCVGSDEGLSYTTTCLPGVNVASAQSNYFFNNSTNAPLNTWDFSEVWQTTTGLPTLRTIPQTPAEVRVALTSSSIRVMWDVPESDGGSPITTYDVKYRKSGTSDYTLVTGIAATAAPEYTISSGLTPSTGYEIEVRANNLIGPGPWLGFITFTTASSLTSQVLAVSKTPTPYSIADVTTDSVDISTPKDSLAVSNSEKDQATDGASNQESSAGISPVLVTVLIIVVLVGGILLIRLFVIRQ